MIWKTALHFIPLSCRCHHVIILNSLFTTNKINNVLVLFIYCDNLFFTNNFSRSTYFISDLITFTCNRNSTDIKSHPPKPTNTNSNNHDDDHQENESKILNIFHTLGFHYIVNFLLCALTAKQAIVQTDTGREKWTID